MSRVSFGGERYVLYGILRKKEMNNKRNQDKSEKTLTKKDEQYKEVNPIKKIINNDIKSLYTEISK